MLTIVLPNTTDKLQLVTSGTSAIDVTASYSDNNSGTLSHNRQLTAISSAATTDVLGSPGASNVRALQLLTARNKGTANNDLTLLYNANGTTYEICKFTTHPGEVLTVSD